MKRLNIYQLLKIVLTQAPNLLFVIGITIIIVDKEKKSAPYIQELVDSNLKALVLLGAGLAQTAKRRMVSCWI